MSGAGTILQGIGTLFSGFAANAAARSQSRQLNLGADQVRREAGIGAALTYEQGQRQTGDLIVNAAASGGGTGGSALNVLRDLERQISFQALNTVISGENKGKQLNYQAAVVKRQGVLAQSLGMINAGATFLNVGDSASASSGGAAGASGGGAE